MSQAQRSPVAAALPNDLESFWMPFTANRAFKKSPRMIVRAKDMHYYAARRPRGDRRRRRHVVHQCGPQPRPDRRGDPAAGGRTRLCAGVPVRPSQSVRAGEPRRRARAGRPRPCVLRQFGLGGGRHRAQDRARLSQHPRRGRAQPADRSRARLPRRRLRRHRGRRHRQQPQAVRHAAGRRRPSAAHLQPRAAGVQQGRARTGARISRTNSSGSRRCTIPRPSRP